MTASRLQAPAALALLALGCSVPEPELPTSPEPPSLAAGPCELGLTAAEARANIQALLAEITALEAAGVLNSGHANALRKHLGSALRAIDAGDLCGALVKLRAFRDQVDNFTRDGVLEPSEASPLLEDADEITFGRFQLAFESERDGNYEIYLANQDGSGLSNLTNHGAADHIESRAWSPDGGRLLFLSERTGVFQVYVMNGDGSGVSNLSNDASIQDFKPTWSPDGTKVLFMRRFGSGQEALYIANANGSSPQPIIFDPGLLTDPEWSPDGSRILFGSDRDGGGLYLINPDGTGFTKIPGSSPVLYAHWSPDGGRIAFSGDAGGVLDLFTIAPDGSGIANLSNTPTAYETEFDWAPDGRRIAYTRRVAGTLDFQIYRMNADGSGQVNISNDDFGESYNPHWSPDGRKIAYVRRPALQSFEVFTMNADGSAQVNVSLRPGHDLNPVWRPR